MVLTGDELFRIVERWAVGTAEGFVEGRVPGEDQVALQEFVSKLTWATPPGVSPAPLPSMKPLWGTAPKAGDSITAGPFHGALSIKLPPFLAKWFGVPPADDTGLSPRQTSQILSVLSEEPLSIKDFPTCTQKGIFDLLKPGEHPPHPVLEFFRPVDHVHVRLSDEEGRMLWDATYKMDGKMVLDNSVKESVVSESLVPDYIPACAVSESHLKLEVDAEYANKPLRIDFLNPGGIKDEKSLPQAHATFVRVPGSPELPESELQRPDAVVCDVTKQDPARDKELQIPVKPKDSAHVYLPDSYREALWRLDRTREESSEINPHGVPMNEFPSTVKNNNSHHSDCVKNFQSPLPVGAKYHVLPRRARMPAEIRVDQLERGNMHLFDARRMPKDISRVDQYALMSSDMFHQPTVQRTVYGPMWQGFHDEGTPLHPSLQFRHPANIAHVTLRDKTNNDRVLWDAIFDVKGTHKIAADQKPVGGTLQEFRGLDPGTRKEQHVYSVSVEADNPSEILNSSSPSARLIDFWRKSEFLFGASRPTTHSEILLRVGNLFQS